MSDVQPQARSLLDVRDLEGAETELRDTLRIEPRDPRALTNLGEVLRATGRAREAVALYREALDADPTYAHAAARLGVTLENLGDRQGALAAYQRAFAQANDQSLELDQLVPHILAAFIDADKGFQAWRKAQPASS